MVGLASVNDWQVGLLTNLYQTPKVLCRGSPNILVVPLNWKFKAYSCIDFVWKSHTMLKCRAIMSFALSTY